MCRSKITFLFAPLIFILFLVSFNSLSAQTLNDNKKPETKPNSGSNPKKIDTAGIAGNYSTNHSQVKLLPPEKLTKDYTDALKQILNLNNAQYDKMLQVNRALIDKIDALVYSSKDYSTFLQGLKLADKIRLDKYKVFLTPNQFKAYTQDSSLSGLNKVNVKNNVSSGVPVMK